MSSDFRTVALLTGGYYASILLFLAGLGLPQLLPAPPGQIANPLATHFGLLSIIFAALTMIASLSAIASARNYRSLDMRTRLRGFMPAIMVITLMIFYINLARRGH